MGWSGSRGGGMLVGHAQNPVSSPGSRELGVVGHNEPQLLAVEAPGGLRGQGHCQLHISLGPSWATGYPVSGIKLVGGWRGGSVVRTLAALPEDLIHFPAPT